ncbi:MAG: hypothetical protein R3D89_02130 [Sphingomonadaceae bacterium]
MKNAQARIAASALAIATIIAATPAYAAGVAAGTLIENTAQATFDDGTGTTTVNSNTVSVQVDELLDVTIASQDASAVPLNPDTAILTFEITNTGNGPEAYNLTANPTVTGNDFDTTIDEIAYDSNGNGIYDPGVDTVIAQGGATPSIDADNTLTIFVIASSPTGALTDGDTSQVNLLAEAVTGTGPAGTTFAGQGVGGSDAVVGTTNADADTDGSIIFNFTPPPTVTLVKSAAVSDPFGGSEAVPGATVTFTIVATVNGTGSVTGLHVTDAIPADTTYAAGSLTLDAGSLTDASGDDSGIGGASGIDVDLGTVASGNSHTVTFDVTIN